jgi:predicted RNase H-like HicB family nuclease
MKKPLKKARVREFTVIIEQDEDGYYVANVPALKSCYTQARTLEDLSPRIREVIKLCLAEQEVPRLKFVALQQVEVPA